MGKHHHKNSNSPSNSSKGSNVSKGSNILSSLGGFNIGDLLKNIDFNQIISLLSSFSGAKNMNTDQLSSMLRNFDLGDMNKESSSSKIDIDKLRSQLSVLADRLDEVEGGKGGNVHDELMRAVQNIQNSPGGQDALFDLIKSNLNVNDDDDSKDRRKNK